MWVIDAVLVCKVLVVYENAKKLIFLDIGCASRFGEGGAC